VPDRTDAGRSVRNRPRRRWLVSGESRFVVVVAVIAVILGVIVGGHLYGRYLSSRETRGRDNAIEELRAESQELKKHGDDLSAQITQLQTKLASAQAMVESIVPSKDTYNFNPNETRIVADGHLTIGLIGSPGNDAVTLNINGKQQTAAAGQVVNVDSNCRVGVQSFDMFKAVLTASCADQKQQ
jgi:cell division protein FtsB